MSKKIRAEMRGDMKRVLASLDSRWIEAASREVCQKLGEFMESLDGKVRCVLAWVSAFPGEVNLTSLIGDQLGKREVYLPRVLPNGTMNFIAVGPDWSESLREGGFGIMEPQEISGKQFDVADSKNSVILVPGLVFDAYGNRLGRGKGYYDKFLGTPEMAGVVKVGVGWSLQRVAEIPIFKHDVPVNWICDERDMYRALESSHKLENT